MDAEPVADTPVARMASPAWTGPKELALLPTGESRRVMPQCLRRARRRICRRIIRFMRRCALPDCSLAVSNASTPSGNTRTPQSIHPCAEAPETTFTRGLFFCAETQDFPGPGRFADVNAVSVYLNGPSVELNGSAVELNGSAVGLNARAVGENACAVGSNGALVGHHPRAVGFNGSAVGANARAVGLHAPPFSSTERPLG
jgi:hypothetical protein